MDKSPDPVNLRIQYLYPMFPDYVTPNGALTLQKECHACFYYALLAAKARGLVGEGPDSQIIQYRVGDTPPEWMESRDEEIARSIAILYGLESPDEFLRFRKEAWTQAMLLGVELPREIFEVRPGVARKQ